MSSTLQTMLALAVVAACGLVMARRFLGGFARGKRGGCGCGSACPKAPAPNAATSEPRPR